MKSLKMYFLWVGAFFLIYPSLAQNEGPKAQYDFHFKIQEVLDSDPTGPHKVNIDGGESSGLKAGASGTLFARWSEAHPERVGEIGHARVTEVFSDHAVVEVSLNDDKIDSGVRIKDLVELKVEINKFGYDGILFDLYRNKVGIFSIYEEPFYVLADMMDNIDGWAGEVDENWKGWENWEAELFSEMIKDVHFVAGEMRKQMDEPMVTGGRFDGIPLFDAMEKSSEQDLKDFFSYIRFSPGKYKGFDWKVSEIFATWIVSETPTPEDAFQVLITEIDRDIEAEREEMEVDKELVFNVKKGTINKVKGSASQEEVKEALPFFTGDTPDGSEFNCGGGVFFLNHDFYFYTHSDGIEVRTGFKGKITIDLLGKNKGEVIKIMGKPHSEPEFEGYSRMLYKMNYGTLELEFNTHGKVNSMGAYYQNPEDLVICW